MKYLCSLFIIFAFFVFGSYTAGADDLIHVVGRGETIYSISRFYRVAADELMRVNNITDPSTLQVGRRLAIPSAAFSDIPAPPDTQALTDYRAVRGDTLFSIARTHGITLARLQEINRFPANHVLRAGDVIRVPVQTVIVQPVSPAASQIDRLFTLRWPVTPNSIAYMTGQMGVVVEGAQNEPVRSLTQGNVVAAGPWRKFGRVVIVEVSGGYFYMYGGLDNLTVNIGDRLTPGVEVGRLGINSISQRPQLFFMVFRNDNPIDPAQAPRAGESGS